MKAAVSDTVVTDNNSEHGLYMKERVHSMGVLGKFGGKKGKGKQAEEKQVKAKAPKKSLFGGKKKKDQSLMDRMQLEESVAEATLEVVEELVELGGSAVREVDSGLLIVAFDEEMLESTGLDPAGADFGSFADALRSETIESITLEADLEAGVVGIIPSYDTLAALDEYDFAHDMEFKWAIVPFNLSDSDQLHVLDSTVHISKLIELANDGTIQLRVDGDEVVEVRDDATSHDEDVYDDEPEDEVETEVEDDPSDYGEDVSTDYDDPDEYDSPADYSTDDPGDYVEDDYSTETYDDTSDLDLASDDDDYELPADDTSDDSTEEEEAIAEETKESLNRLVEHGFVNNELDLSINMAVFDDFFDSTTPVRFELPAQLDGDSELERVIVNSKHDANSEIERFHQENIRGLRNKFTMSVRSMVDKLTETLDHKNNHTTYGKRYDDILDTYEDKTRNIDRESSERTREIKAGYNARREEFGDVAKREAMSQFDIRYHSEHAAHLADVKTDILTEVKTTRDTELGNLYSDRQLVARRLLDKAITALLQHLQQEYQNIAEVELKMYDEFRKDIDVYGRKHFADEVLRSKAEAEKLKQSHEADRVRSEYDQILKSKNTLISEMEHKFAAERREMSTNAKEQLESVESELRARLDRAEKENEKLRSDVDAQRDATLRIGKEKQEEVEHQIKVLESQVKAKETELGYANDRANRAQKPLIIISVAVATLGIAIGLIIGFIFATNNAQPAAPAPIEQPGYGYEIESDETDDAYAYDLVLPDVETTETSSDVSVDHAELADYFNAA